MKKINSLALFIIAINLQAQLAFVSPFITVTDESITDDISWNIQEHVLNIDSMLIDSLLQIGYEDFQNGRFILAEEMLTESINESKNSLEYSYFYRGLARFACKKYKLARVDFTKCLMVNSQIGDAYFLRAMTKIQLGENEKAEIDFEKVFLPGNTLSTLSLDRVVEIVDLILEKVKANENLVPDKSSTLAKI